MKLVWKGIYNKVEQLELSKLPENAVKFKEPGTPLMLNIIASLFMIPIMIFIITTIVVKSLIDPSFREGLGNFSLGNINLTGFILAILMIVPHEFLHGVAFPKGAEAQVWFSPKNLIAFVYSTFPTSKARFIFISLLPNLIFGFIPLILWVVIPYKEGISEILLSFSSLSLLLGAGDFLNVFNAIIQMPKNSMTQLHGFNSYWYMPHGK